MRIFSRRAVTLFTLMAAFVEGGASAQSRTARTIRIDSAAIGSPVTVAVLTPVDYDSTTLRYPVVYLLHGGTQNHTAFPARSARSLPLGISFASDYSADYIQEKTALAS